MDPRVAFRHRIKYVILCIIPVRASCAPRKATENNVCNVQLRMETVPAVIDSAACSVIFQVIQADWRTLAWIWERREKTKNISKKR